MGHTIIITLLMGEGEAQRDYTASKRLSESITLGLSPLNACLDGILLLCASA